MTRFGLQRLVMRRDGLPMVDAGPIATTGQGADLLGNVSGPARSLGSANPERYREQLFVAGHY